MVETLRKLVQAASVGALAFVVIWCLSASSYGGRLGGRSGTSHNEELAFVGGIAAAALVLTRKK